MILLYCKLFEVFVCPVASDEIYLIKEIITYLTVR